MQIRRTHTLEKKEVRQRVEALVSALSSKYGLSSEWSGGDLKFDGSGVNGCIGISGTCVVVDLKLGFALTMLEGSIRSSIEEAMDTHLQ